MSLSSMHVEEGKIDWLLDMISTEHYCVIRVLWKTLIGGIYLVRAVMKTYKTTVWKALKQHNLEALLN